MSPSVPLAAPDVRLVCRDCGQPLRTGGGDFSCDGCGLSYPSRDGVAVFAEGSPFYESYAEVHIPYARNPPGWKRMLLRVLPYWSWREWRFFTRQLRPGDAIIDLGCGRGKEWFTGAGRFVAGVDPCWTVLPECARHYDVVAQAEIAALPFGDATFDCAVTSHVLGHIPVEQKDAALAEVARVLRPGGRFLNVVETDSNHAFARLGKSDLDLYRSNFVETDGHVGLELPSAVLERFRRSGFDVTGVTKMESGLIHLRYYEKYLGIGYPERSARVQRRIRLWRRIERNPVALFVYEVAMGGYHRVVEPWRTPLDDAMFLAVHAVRRPS